MSAENDADRDSRPAEPQRDLVVAELAVARAHLTGSQPDPACHELGRRRAAMGMPGRMDELTTAFGLSSFEREVLLLASGPDLVGEVARELQKHTGQARLSFGAALEHLPDAHWDALTPAAPLRHWELLRLAAPDAVLTGPLVVDERIIHHLAGVEALDEQVELISRPVAPPRHLPRSHARIVAELVDRWGTGGPLAIRGPQPRTLRALAAATCLSVGLEPRLIGAADLPETAVELVVLLRRLVREAALVGVAWLVDLDGAPGVPAPRIGQALADTDAPIVMLASHQSDGAALSGLGISVVDVPRLGAGERRDLLGACLEAAEANVSDEDLEAAAGAFDLSLPDIEQVAAEVARGLPLWSACRHRPRAGAGALARVRLPQVGWENLVLPPVPLDQVKALTAAVRHRSTVLDDWGFGAHSGRGRGTTALFTGASGTGKTLAAEVIAHELDLDLVQVDLSQVVDKYIGETEKRLAQLFDAAEDGGMVLLFDEADALFGKRTEVKDSHDRYANVEVGYLLQRLETFAGLAILTTNARTAIDNAFTRRLSAIVSFPYPDKDARLRMWRQSIPEAAPHEDLDLDRLANADLPGGGIAAAALQAAYLAAAEGGVLRMDHLSRAVTWELAKTGRVASRPAGKR